MNIQTLQNSSLTHIVQQEDQPIDASQLLDTDNRVVLPINSPIRIIVTAADVLHS